MKSKLTIAALVAIGAFLIFPSRAVAQEGEPVVVDEVIAQVNDGVVTLAQLKREMKERVETLKQNGMSEAQANAEVEKHRSELIATLINEQLLLQKGKDLDLTDRVEAEVNRRMLDVAKENHITSIEKLDDEMRKSGLAGKPEADVKARATQLVTQLRGGADFGTLAKAFSERGAENNGKVGLLMVQDLRPDIAAAIKNVKAGGVSDPFKTDEGYEIIRVDARTAGSSAASFNENQVREAITAERSPEAREKYLQQLRNDGYVKIAESYREAVEPLLKIVPPAAATRRPPKKDKKEKNSKP